MDQLEAIQYPIGRYKPLEHFEVALQGELITAIEALPSWLDAVVENLDAYQLNTSYRPGGWTITQVIHHLADSHMHAYLRTKLALTEDSLVIKPYDQNQWALLPDVLQCPINVSITLLHALHRRWGIVFRQLQEQDWQRSYYHPEYAKHYPLYELANLYAWHGRHHMEQIRHLRNRMGW